MGINISLTDAGKRKRDTQSDWKQDMIEAHDVNHLHQNWLCLDEQGPHSLVKYSNKPNTQRDSKDTVSTAGIFLFAMSSSLSLRGTIALLAVVLVFSLVWRISHGQIDL
ncbi:hypothetical protein N7465_008998 [Penicillium sp. CMV-2018d]|nr:hypothetical protein N7465_008998 [Penicillium sp. CMV-2018d]